MTSRGLLRKWQVQLFCRSRHKQQFWVKIRGSGGSAARITSSHVHVLWAQTRAEHIWLCMATFSLSFSSIWLLKRTTDAGLGHALLWFCSGSARRCHLCCWEPYKVDFQLSGCNPESHNFATSYCFARNSMPMKRRPSISAAAPHTPVFMQISMTRPPGGV